MVARLETDPNPIVADVFHRSGLVEAKLRHLVSKLEMLDNVQLAHPFNKGFDFETECSTEDEAFRVARGESINRSEANALAEGSGSNENGTTAANKIIVYTTSFYVGLVLDTSKFCREAFLFLDY